MKPRFTMLSRYKWTVSTGPGKDQTLTIERTWTNNKSSSDRFRVGSESYGSLTDAAYAAAEKLGYQAW